MLHQSLAAAVNRVAEEYGPVETAIGVAVWLTILAALWLLPTIVAVRRRVRNVGSIAVINVLFGWTFVGWVAALALAAQTVPDQPLSRETAPTPHAWRPLVHPADSAQPSGVRTRRDGCPMSPWCGRRCAGRGTRLRPR